MANLTITFTPVTPTPPNGYRVKYWNVLTPGSILTISPNPTTSPIVITGVTPGNSYSGTIEASCANGGYSSVQSFTVSGGSGDPCGDQLIPLAFVSNESGFPCIVPFTNMTITCSNGNNVTPPQSIVLGAIFQQELIELLTLACNTNADIEDVTNDIVDLLNDETISGLSGFNYVAPGIISVNNVSSTFCPGGEVTGIFLTQIAAVP